MKRNTVITTSLKTVIFKKVNSIIDGNSVGSLDIQMKEVDLPQEDISHPCVSLPDSHQADETTSDKRENANGCMENTSDNFLEGSGEKPSQKGSDKDAACILTATIPNCLISGIAYLEDERLIVSVADSRKLILIDEKVSQI